MSSYGVYLLVKACTGRMIVVLWNYAVFPVGYRSEMKKNQLPLDVLYKYLDWYDNDVIPGFERQLAKQPKGKGGMFRDAIRRSKGHRDRIANEIANLEANKAPSEEGAVSYDLFDVKNAGSGLLVDSKGILHSV